MVTVLVVILVAKKVWDSLPLILCSQWKASSSGDQDNLRNANGSMNAEESASPSMDFEWFESLDAKDDKLPEMYLPLNKSILKSVKLMDKELKLHPTIDCFCSGTTAVTLEKQVWDVLSNKEAVEVVASAPSHATAAGTLVDCAVRHGGLSILPPRMMIVLLYACF